MPKEFVGPPDPKVIRKAVERGDKKRGIHPAFKYGPAIAHGLDALSTDIALNNGRKEGNPVLAPFAGNDAALYATKIGVGLGMGLLADHLHRKGHKTAGNIIGSINITLPIAAAAYNASQTGKRK